MPAVARVRRVQQVTPRTGRGLPGMPLEMEDPDGEGGVRLRGFDGGRGRWWRPASTTGRVFLGFCAFLVLSGLTTATILLKNYLERDGHFRIAGTSDIQATGLSEVSRAELLPVFGEDIGRNVFFVPINERRKELEAIPWIEKATVMRILPDEIRVAVVERQPVAFTRNGRQIGLVDASGVLLSMSPQAMAAHHYSFPVLTGIDPRDTLEARAGRMAVYMRLMEDLDSTGKHYSQNISEIDLTDPEDARVLMPEAGRDILAHFGQDHFLERYERYREHIAEWRQQYPRLAAVDLRYDRQVVLQMASGAQASTSGGGVKGAENTDKPSADGPVEKGKATTKPAAKSKAKARRISLRERSRETREGRHAELKRAALHGAASAIGPGGGTGWGQ